MRTVDSLEKTLMLGGIGGRRRRGRQRMRWLDGITDSMDVSLMNSGSWWWTGRPGVLQFMGSQRVGHDWATEVNWYRLWNWMAWSEAPRKSGKASWVKWHLLWNVNRGVELHSLGEEKLERLEKQRCWDVWGQGRCFRCSGCCNRNPTNIYFSVLEARKSEVKVPADPVAGRGPGSCLMGSQVLTVLSHKGESRGKPLFLDSSKGTNPLYEGSTLVISSSPNHAPKAPTLIP